MTDTPKHNSGRFLPAVPRNRLVYVEGFGDIVLSQFTSRNHGAGIQAEVHRLGDETVRRHGASYAMTIDHDLAVDWTPVTVGDNKSALSELEHDVVRGVLETLEERDPKVFLDLLTEVTATELASYYAGHRRLTGEIAKLEKWLAERSETLIRSPATLKELSLNEKKAELAEFEAGFAGRNEVLTAIHKAAYRGDLVATQAALEMSAEVESEQELEMSMAR